MSLVTISRYRAITGDVTTDSVTVSAKIDVVTDLCADELGRELAYGTYTERLYPTRDGYLWPSVVPIMSCAAYDIDGDGLFGTFGVSWPNQIGYIDVTYSGGWVERTANPGAPNRLPECIEADICWAAFALATQNPAAQTYPPGATSIRLGDAAVTFGPNGAPDPSEIISWSDRTKRYTSRTTRGTGIINRSVGTFNTPGAP